MLNFSVLSGKIQVTDPCYSPTIKDHAGAFNAKNGRWNAAIVEVVSLDGERRNKELLIWHASEARDYAETATRDSKINVSVDSGQAGFFDAAAYVDYKAKDEDEAYTPMKLYPFGLVVSAGYGDGSYRCYIKFSGKEVVAARLIFIELEGESEDI